MSYFTLLIIASVYCNLWRYVNLTEKDKTTANSWSVTANMILQALNHLTSLTILFLYSGLLVAFRKLIREQNQFLKQMESHVTFFFVVAISTIATKIVINGLETYLSYEVQVKSQQKSKEFFLAL